MPMHKVEVDDEVFAFVQKHAEPLVDSFNSALRRLLSAGKATVNPGPAAPATGAVKGGEGYQIPRGTPHALGQILEVVRLVFSGRSTRSGATHQVAAKLGVAPQTVLDKYTRQLGLTAGQFDHLLTPERRDELLKTLHSKFPEHVNTIDQMMGANITTRKMVEREHLLEIAGHLFGPKHGIDLPLPPRGTAPDRPPPHFTELERDR